MRTQYSKRAGGFTLVELLVVIGIIGVLVGILIPTVNGVRKAARKADTKSLLSRMSSSIEAYRSEFSTYPGVVSNRLLIAGTVSGVYSMQLDAPGAMDVDSSNNLVLSLSGGLNMAVSGTSGTYSFDRQYVGRGPVCLKPTAPKAYGPYMEVKASELFYANASAMPYFADKYPTAQPILYVRANPGVTADGNITHEIGDASVVGQQVVYDTRLFNYLDAQGNRNPIEPYTSATNATFLGSSNVNEKWAKYLGNASTSTGGIATQAVNRDSYVLISAGEDGFLGTPDDVTNYGTVGGD